MLRSTGYKDRRIAANIYKLQLAYVKIDGYDNYAIIKKVVRQGCIVTPETFQFILRVWSL